MSPDDPDATSAEDLYESLVVAYDEALARGEAPSLDESCLPAELKHRLHAALACVSLLNSPARKPGARVAEDGLPSPSPKTSTACEGHPSGTSVAGVPPAAPLKSKIGRFELMREIGRGGHGVVFLAIDPRLRRLVAIKVPRPEVLVTPDLHRRFLREGRAASALAHPNLVPIFEVGDDGPLCYIAAGYCEGPSLARWLKDQSLRLPWQEAAELVARLTNAASHAHARGIVHRDIKPANVLLAPADAGSSGATPLLGQLVVPCLTDFGLARLIDDDASDRTRTGTMLGTPSYMAPEQADGRIEEIGPATDVYALGAILYELLTGRAPFRGANDLETLRLVSAGELMRPSDSRAGLPRDLEAICVKALSASPADRYSTAAAFAADLRRFTKGEPTLARPLSRMRRILRSLRRRPVRSGMAAVILVLIAALGGGARWHSTRLAESLEASRQAGRHRDELRYDGTVRAAWQAYNSDNAAQARSILERAAGDLQDVHRNFAWQLLWNLTHKSELLTLRGHTGDVYHVAISPDGRLLATASQDQTVRLWDAATGKLQATLTGHTGEVNAVAWSPDGKLLASASDDGSLRLWDAVEARSRESVLRADRGPIVSLAFTADGALLVSGDDRGGVHFTDTATWQTVNIHQTGGGRVHGLTLTHDGNWLATATDNSGVQVWDLHDGGRLNTSPEMNGRARAVAFDHRDQLLACGNMWAYHWNCSANNEPRLVYDSPDFLSSIAFCGGDKLAATTGQDDIVRVFDIARVELRQVLLGHTERIWCVAASPDGWRLATASADDTVKLWSLSGAQAVVAIEHSVSLKNVAFMADGQTLVSVIDDGGLLRWRLHAAEVQNGPGVSQLAEAHLIGPSSATVGRIRDISISPEGTLAAVRDRDWAVELLQVQTDMPIAELAAPAESREDGNGAVVFSPNGRTLAQAVGSSVRIWDLSSRQIVRRLESKARVFALDFSPDCKFLATAVGNHVELWDASTGKLLHDWPAHRGAVHVVAFSPSGLLATASQDRLVRLWDATTGQIVATLSGHAAAVEAICFSPDGQLLASGGHDRMVKLWSLQSHEEIATLKDFPGQVRGLSFSPTKMVLAATGRTDDGHGHLHLWCASPDAHWQHVAP